MTNYTEAEVEAAFENVDEDLYWGDLEWYLTRQSDAPGSITLRGELVPVTLMESETGHEGDWDIATYVVISVGTQTFRKTGRYQSHIGDAWDGPLKEVVSTEKMMTVFVNKEDVVTNYTESQVRNAIESAEDFDGWGEAEYWVTAENQPEYYSERRDARLRLDIGGTQEYAEFAGGKLPFEGGGERIYVVVKVGDQHFRKSGYYLSHDGAYWDGSFDEVHPVEKTVTVYETL